MTERTRIALVGVNDRARRLLLPGLAASPRARLAAICSRDPEKARATASALGPAVRVYTDIGRLLADRVCDALYVNTPVETHLEICLAALRAGCAVICEKPLAPTAGEAETLVREAERAGVRTVVNFTYRSVPGFRLAERWLAANPLGAPRHARFELLQGHNFFPGFRHGSALLDSGSHLFDLMAALLRTSGFGEITAVAGAPLSNEQPDYGWSGTVRTPGGAVGVLFSRSALGWRNGFRWTLAGDQAALEVELDANHTVARAVQREDGAPQGMWRPLSVPPDLAADDARFPAYHLDRLVGAVQGEEAFPTFADALLPNRLAEALAASALEGRWVRL